MCKLSSITLTNIQRPNIMTLLHTYHCNFVHNQRKRRHSLSSTRSLTTGTETHHLANSKSKQTDTNKTSTLDRIHHHSTFREPKTEGLKKTGRTSLLRIFKSKSAKKRLQMEAYKDMESEKV